MDISHRGFSLIEALVSVLVLTIGLLGLGQLQARLWSASGNLHAVGSAHLLAITRLENSVTSQLFGMGTTETAETSVTHSGTTFGTVLSVSPGEFLTETGIRIYWDTPSGSHSIQLSTDNESGSTLSDTRWLLPAD